MSATTLSSTDRLAHEQTCVAQPGGAWTDRCVCGEMRIGHEDAIHKGITNGRGTTCYGRNGAGPCRTCDCKSFQLARAQTTTERKAA